MAVVVMASCDGSSPTQPLTSSVPTPVPPAQPADSQLIGPWNGSTRVTTIEGLGPDCLPPFLERGFTDVLAAEIFTQGTPRLLLYLEQEAIGGSCYFDLSTDMTSVRATGYGKGAWDYDDCQIELDSSSWGCRAAAPEVWIFGILLEGTFTDTARDRIHGSLRVRHQHRAGDTQPYADFVVTEEFTLTQVAK